MEPTEILILPVAITSVMPKPTRIAGVAWITRFQKIRRVKNPGVAMAFARYSARKITIAPYR